MRDRIDNFITDFGSKVSDWLFDQQMNAHDRIIAREHGISVRAYRIKQIERRIRLELQLEEDKNTPIG